jgi:hypothetical protein
VFAIGGGIGSLAAAAFMIRDGGLPGANITIYEALPVLGASLDAAGNPETGYSLRGGRMFTTDNYECTWGLFKQRGSAGREPHHRLAISGILHDEILVHVGDHIRISALAQRRRVQAVPASVHQGV